MKILYICNLFSPTLNSLLNEHKLRRLSTLTEADWFAEEF